MPLFERLNCTDRAKDIPELVNAVQKTMSCKRLDGKTYCCAGPLDHLILEGNCYHRLGIGFDGTQQGSKVVRLELEWAGARS